MPMNPWKGDINLPNFRDWLDILVAKFNSVEGGGVDDDSVTNAKLANMGDSTIKGRVSGSGTGDPQDLTATQVRTIINVEDGATADQTADEIKTLYESNADTNAFTDAEQTKLGYISSTKAVDLDAVVQLKGDWDISGDTFITSAGVGLAGVAIDPNTGNLISVDTGATDTIYVYDGISGSVVDSFPAPGTAPSGLAVDSAGNLISTDNGTDLIYVHDGISDTISSSFAVPAGSILDIAIDGSGNLISTSGTTRRIYVHDGISSTILSDFSYLTGSEVFSGITIDGSGNLISADTTGTGTIRVHSGISATITSSFPAPDDSPTGLVFDSLTGNLISGSNLPGGDNDNIFVHNGIAEWDATEFPGAGVAQAGWSYIVTTAGTVDGVDFSVGDRILAITNNASTSTYAGNWLKLDYTDQVSSVFGRTGAVVAETGDYDADQISETASNKIMTAAERTNLANQSGTNTGDQTITLTGDVTGSGTGSFAATIANDAVTNAKAANMAQNTMKGRADAAGTGDPTDLTIAQVLAVLGLDDGGSDLFPDRLRYTRSYNVNSTDLNDLTTSGFYDGSTLTNSPDGSANWFYVIVQRHTNANGYCVQYAFTLAAASPAFYVRSQTATTWNSWQLIFANGDKGDITVSDAGATWTIDNNAVSNTKLADMVQSSIKGRAAGAGTGDPVDLTAAQVRTLINVADGANNYSHPNHSGDVTSSGDGATTIANNAVTNAKAADMAEATIKGRAAGAGTGDPTDLTAAQALTLLGLSTGTHNTNISGLTGTVNINITYRLFGGIVVLHVPDFSGTNDDADALQTATVLPANLRPSSARQGPIIPIIRGSTNSTSSVTVSSAGQLLWNGDPDSDSENWQSEGAASFNQCYRHTIVYSL